MRGRRRQLAFVAIAGACRSPTPDPPAPTAKPAPAAAPGAAPGSDKPVTGDDLVAQLPRLPDHLTAMERDFSIALTGDTIITQPIAVRIEADPRARPIMRLIGDATVAATNWESTTLDPHAFVPRAQAVGAILTAVYSTPDDVLELKKLGFDMIALGNNHQGDFGGDGIRETLEAIDRAGLAHAGLGMNLGLARAPAFVTTPAGRVGMISIAVSHKPVQRASYGRDLYPGRPGVNFVKLTQHIFVAKAALQPTLDALAALKPAIANDNVRLHTTSLELSTWIPTTIEAGEPARVEFAIDPDDWRAVLLEVRRARMLADYVFVSVHIHEPSNSAKPPGDFARALTHSLIDAGADAVFGHGPHRLRGVELYRGRPIFHSLGAFAFQLAGNPPQPDDIAPGTSYAEDLSATLRQEETDPTDPSWWQGAIAVLRYGAGNQLAGIQLHPVDIESKGPPAARGRIPHVPEPADAKAMLDELAELSRPLGTTLHIHDGVADVDLAGAAR